MAVITGTAVERCDTPIWGDIVGLSDELIVQADVDSISVDVWDIAASPKKRVYGPTDIDPAAVIDDSPPDGGYNFYYVLPAAAVPYASQFHVDIEFTMDGGAVICGQAEFKALKRYNGVANPEPS